MKARRHETKTTTLRNRNLLNEYWHECQISSATFDPKQLIGNPLFFPKFDQTGEDNEKNP